MYYTIEDLIEALEAARDNESEGEEIDTYREISHYLIDDLIAAYLLVHSK